MTRGIDLPSIKALRTFMAVATTLSFSRAADELCVSQGAVSKQVAALERYLGQPLFLRGVGGIELTNAGKRYLPQVAEALQIIQSSTANMLQTEADRELLCVDVTPSFASLWLIEKMVAFTAREAQLQINVTTGDGPVKNSNGDQDIFTRCLPLLHHYDHARLLRREKLLLVAAPELIRQRPIHNKDDFSAHTLIPQVTRPQLWEQFKSEHLLPSNSHYFSVGFEHFYMSLEAVLHCRGLALLPDFMAHSLLDEGRLVNPLGLSMESLFGYYVIIPSYKQNLRKVCAFDQWLNEELGD
jgi:DNA-binding transcriptional LysR family regulator